MKLKTYGITELKEHLLNFSAFPEKDISELNRKRANAFRDFLIDSLRNGTIPVEPIKDESHKPLYDTGKLAENCEVEEISAWIYKVGYFDTNKNKPDGTTLTYPEIAIVQSSGFNNGRAVVVPRPFFDIAWRMWNESGKDEKIVDEWYNNLK